MAGSLALEKMKGMGNQAENMSALSVALMGRVMASENDTESLQVDREDKDWNQVISSVKSGGPKSWFAKKVDFTFHEAHFLGRVGYSVRGGVVPLFDGAAIDLSVAELEAKDPKKAEPDARMGSPAGNKNWIVGRGGLLVLAPVGTNNVVPMVTGQVIVTEKGLVTEAQKPLRFQKGEEVVKADRLELSDQIAVLYGIQVEKDGEDVSSRYRTEAVLTGQGLQLVPDGQGYVPGEETQEQEQGNTPGGEGIQETPVNKTLEQINNGVTEILNQVSPEGKLQIGAAKEGNQEEAGTGFGMVMDSATSTVMAGFNTEEKSSEDDEDPLWTQIAKALEEEGTKKAKEILKAAAKGNGKEQLEKTLEEKWEQLKAIYDGFSDEELKESWKEFPDAVREIFRRKVKDEEIEDYLKKLLPIGPISEFLGMKKDEEKETDAEEDGDSKITLARIDLFPGLLSFRVELVPGYKFSAFVVGGAENMKALWDAREEEETRLTLGAGIRGELSLKAAAVLAAGLDLVFQGYGELYAKAALEGGLEDSAGTKVFGGQGSGVAFQTNLELPVKRMRDGSVRQSSQGKATLEGGLNLTGSVGTEIGLRSKILVWEKKLYEKEFAKWDLLSIHAILGLTKDADGGILSGWGLETASVSVTNNFKSAFTKENTAERRYGLYKPEEVDSKNYQDISENFDTALKLLEDFADATLKNGPALAFPREGNDDEGVRGMAVRMEEQLDRITIVWADAQNEMEFLEHALEERKNSSYVKEKYDNAISSRRQHESRMAYLGQWDEARDGNLLDYYENHGSNPGRGFLDFMYQEFMDQNRSYEAIVAYERERYREKTEKHWKRLQELEAMKAGNQSEEEIQKAYFEEMDGGRVKGQNASLQNTQVLLDYEYARLMETTKDARESRFQVMKLAAEKDRKDFFKAYARTYADGGVFKSRMTDGEVFAFGDAGILLDYEKRKFLAEAASQEKDIAMLGAAQAGRELLSQDPQADVQRLATQFRSALKGDSQKVPGLAEAFAEELYRTATVDDLIEIEFQENQGEAGKSLADYLKETTTDVTGKRKKGTYTTIFGSKKGRNQAMERFGAYMEKSATSDLISCLTLDILMDYAKMRQSTSKNKEEEAREIRYLARGQAKMAAAPKGEARKVEEEYIEGYFKLFSGVEKAYRKALVDKEIINLPLMMEAFSDTSQDLAYTKLMEMKEAKEPDYKALMVYLEMKGDEKETIARINEHQRKKAEQTPPDTEDVYRFYESRVAETSQEEKKDNTGHYERYQKLRDMNLAGESYEALLEMYQKLGAGSGYREYLIKELETGAINGREITIEDVLRVEDKRIARFGQKHLERLGMIHQMEDEGKSYGEIFESYKQKAEEEKSFVKRMAKTKTRYEKTMKGQKIDSDALIAYERIRAEEMGKKHAMRLRTLLGLSETSDAFMTADLLTDPDEREAKRADYLSKTKRFKKSDLEEDKKKADFKEELRARPPEELRQSLQSYEAGRKKTYEDKAADILRAQEEIRQMRDDLKKKITICRAMSVTAINIRDNPGMVFKELEKFKEAVNFLKQNSDSDAAAREQSQRAYDHADIAIHRMGEME